MGLFARIEKWRLDRFITTLPPVARRDPQWLLDAFRRDIGREFNPFSEADRNTIKRGLNLAMIKALPVLFGREVGP